MDIIKTSITTLTFFQFIEKCTFMLGLINIKKIFSNSFSKFFEIFSKYFFLETIENSDKFEPYIYEVNLLHKLTFFNNSKKESV